jgi:hypothetical protein
MLEAVCGKCGETFNPHDESDTEHGQTVMGEPCGGQGTIVGEWIPAHTERVSFWQGQHRKHGWVQTWDKDASGERTLHVLTDDGERVDILARSVTIIWHGPTWSAPNN